jgi:TonB family protein
MITRAALLLVLASAAIDAQVPIPPVVTAPLPTIYFDFQVEKPVTASPKNKAPLYPDELRAANIEGEVVAAFVVDSTGRAILSTFKVLKTHHELFTKAVADALPQLRFTPAQIGGKRVAQQVQMPFVFSLAPRDTVSVKRPAAFRSRRQVSAPLR